MTERGESLLSRTVLSLTRFSERWVPSAFVIACLLTFAVVALALGLTPAAPGQVVGYWGDGFWALLSFAMQMCLALMTGSIIADSPLLRRALDRLSRLPRTDRQAVVFAAAASMVLAWLHWGMGMAASAFLARALARRRPKVDYPLLVAVSYFGQGAVWHAGLSGSAPLLVATPGHFLAASIGVIPLSETIFSSFNLALVAVVFVALTILAGIVYPRARDVRAAPAALLEPPAAEAEDLGPAPDGAWLRFWERGWAVCGAVGALGAAYLLRDLRAHGPQFTLDRMNFVFLVLGAALHPSPASFSRAAERAAGYVHGIVIQFPFYAGMYGVIKGSGLDDRIAQAFLKLADARTFPLIVYWYSGVLNYFIPSGGSKWAIEAPYLLQAARALRVSPAATVLAYAWGDMATDLIQPFWCLPLLAVARLEFKDILAYEALAFLVCLILGSAAFYLAF
jgi:short-chain fatty acids transporter